MISKPAKTPIISFNNNTPLFQGSGGIQLWKTSSESLKLRHPTLVNIIFLAAGG